MSGIATAIIGSAVVGAGVGIYSSNKAASAAENAAASSNDVTMQMFNLGREDTKPWRTAGKTALSTLMEKLEAGPGEFVKSPEYNVGLEEGIKATERGAAASYGVLSGREQKALTRFGQDYATKNYQNFLANYYQSLNPYLSIAGLGQTTAAQTASNATATGNTLANNALYAGNAQASGAINTGNAITGALGSGINNYLMWKYLTG